MAKAEELLYSIRSSRIYDMKKQEDQVRSFMVSSEIVEDLFKRQLQIETKSAQLYKVWYKWFTAISLEGRKTRVWAYDS